MVDAYAGTHGGERPKVFLVNLGTPGDFLARSTYAQDFFEAGGFVPLKNDGFSDPQAVIAAFAASGAAIAVICSTDARYATDLEQVAPRLRAAGARIVVLSGNPASTRPGTAPPVSTSSSSSGATCSKSFGRCFTR